MQEDKIFINAGHIVSGIHALAYHTGWVAESDSILYLENTHLYEMGINKDIHHYVYVPESDKNETKDGYACWQKALLDIFVSHMMIVLPMIQYMNL